MTLGNFIYTGYDYNYTEVLASAYAAPLLFINKKINLPKSYLYIGPAAGYMFVLNSGNTYGYTVPGEQMNFGNAQGFAYGLQAGYTLNISKKAALNAEIAYRRAQVSYHVDGPNADDYITIPYDLEHTLIYIPATIGIKYTL